MKTNTVVRKEDEVMSFDELTQNQQKAITTLRNQVTRFDCRITLETIKYFYRGAVWVTFETEYGEYTHRLQSFKVGVRGAAKKMYDSFARA